MAARCLAKAIQLSGQLHLTHGQTVGSFDRRMSDVRLPVSGLIICIGTHKVSEIPS
jgi:hypothetical protein